MKKKLILASGSKQRQDILKMLGLKFSVLTSDIDENSSKTAPDKYVMELSLNKAKNVAARVSGDAVVVAADTVIFCDGKIYEKPKSNEEASLNIKAFSGKTNTAFTGLTFIDLKTEKVLNFATKVDIKFREIEDAEIKWYVDHEEKLLKCCGYSPLGKGAIFIESVSGGDYNTLLGISPSEMCKAFKELGYSIYDFEMERDL